MLRVYVARKRRGAALCLAVAAAFNMRGVIPWLAWRPRGPATHVRNVATGVAPAERPPRAVPDAKGKYVKVLRKL